MKAYSFVQYACLFIKQMRIREWLAVLKVMAIVFVIIELMAWAAEGLFVLVMVFVLYQIAKVFWTLIMARFREAESSLLQRCG